MSYRHGSSSSYYKVSCGDHVPAGVVIGRQGSTIKAMQQISGAQIRIRDNEIQVRGSQKQVATAKGLLSELKNNYSRGIIGLTSTVRPKRVQKKIRVRTNTSSGWSTVESNQTEESAAAKPEPKKDRVCGYQCCRSVPSRVQVEERAVSEPNPWEHTWGAHGSGTDKSRDCKPCLISASRGFQKPLGTSGRFQGPPKISGEGT